MGIAKALVAARNRGVSVQVRGGHGPQQGQPMSGSSCTSGSAASCTARAIRPSRDTVSFARACAGSCRGRGGTPHAKYFLFDKVGRRRQRYITFQTSTNLT